MIVFISCTAKKKDYKCPAKEMYSVSPWFKGGWRYAESLKPRAIYILSAKYGLLNPDDVIEPYNITLCSARKDEIKRWSVMVIRQMQSAGIDRNEKAIFLCGKNYRKYLSRWFVNSSAPCSKMGIGKQMQFFKEMIE